MVAQPISNDESDSSGYLTPRSPMAQGEFIALPRIVMRRGAIVYIRVAGDFAWVTLNNGETLHFNGAEAWEVKKVAEQLLRPPGSTRPSDDPLMSLA